MLLDPPNVNILLLADPSVVLLLLFNTSTVLRAERFTNYSSTSDTDSVDFATMMNTHARVKRQNKETRLERDTIAAREGAARMTPAHLYAAESECC